MKQAAFERLHTERWAAFTTWIDARHRMRTVFKRKKADAHIVGFRNSEFPRRYREICQHLAIARERQYGAELVERLNRLALAGYHELHDAKLGLTAQIVEFYRAEFPRLVRGEWPLVTFAAVLLFVPMLAMAVITSRYPDAALYFITPDMLADLRAMYSNTERIVHRKADSDVAAFGYYIWNNISIDFRTFASGLVFGLGSIALLLYNGFFLGAVNGYLMSAGLGENLLQFVAGHSGPELIAAVLSGVAGLKLGGALIAPGDRSRKSALVDAGRIAIRILYGAAAMTLFAAFIEAFWSSHRFVSIPLKLWLGGALWIAIIAYLALCGRTRMTAAPGGHRGARVVVQG